MIWECFTFSSPCLYITQYTIVLHYVSIRYIHDRPYAALPRGAGRGSEAASGRHRLADKSNALLGNYANFANHRKRLAGKLMTRLSKKIEIKWGATVFRPGR